MSPLLQVCCALAQIAKHSVDLAEVVVEAEVFPKILTCLKFPDELVRKHTATVVREVSGRQPPQWAPVSCSSRARTMWPMTLSHVSLVKDTLVSHTSSRSRVNLTVESLSNIGGRSWLHLHARSTRCSARRQLAPPLHGR